MWSFIKRLYLELSLFPIHLFESLKTRGMADTLNDFIYFNRELVLAEKDISSIQLKEGDPQQVDVKGVEVNRDTFDNLHLKYGLRSRYIKSLQNVRHGYRSFAIIKDDKVIGDIWYSSANPNGSPNHPDLQWLGIHLGDNDVYLWDVYVDPKERKGLPALFLFKYTLHMLKKQGYEKAYGFIFCDNKPSLGLIRLLKFKELERKISNRFIFYKNSKPAPLNVPIG